jgi:hypothetical protein
MRIGSMLFVIMSVLATWQPDDSRFKAACAAEPKETSQAEMQRIDQESRRIISLVTTNRFHARFLRACITILPEDTELVYLGDLAADRRLPKFELHDSATSLALYWTVQDSHFELFRFWISVEPTSQTAGKTTIDKQVLFMNVDSVDGNKGVDAKLPQLGNRSVREVLKLLDTTENGATDNGKKLEQTKKK